MTPVLIVALIKYLFPLFWDTVPTRVFPTSHIHYRNLKNIYVGFLVLNKLSTIADNVQKGIVDECSPASILTLLKNSLRYAQLAPLSGRSPFDGFFVVEKKVELVGKNEIKTAQAR